MRWTLTGHQGDSDFTAGNWKIMSQQRIGAIVWGKACELRHLSSLTAVAGTIGVRQKFLPEAFCSLCAPQGSSCRGRARCCSPYRSVYTAKQETQVSWEVNCTERTFYPRQFNALVGRHVGCSCQNMSGVHMVPACWGDKRSGQKGASMKQVCKLTRA